MSTPSKAEQYRQACALSAAQTPKDLTIGTLRFAVARDGGLEVWLDGYVHYYSPTEASGLLAWCREMFEPPQDAVAEIVKGLRGEEIPEVELTEEENRAFREQLQYSSKTTPAQDVDMIYRAGAEAMWEKVRGT